MRRLIAICLTLAALGLSTAPALAEPPASPRSSPPRTSAPRNIEEWRQLPPEQRVALVKQGLVAAKAQAERWERIYKTSKGRRGRAGTRDERRLVALHLELIELRLKAARKQVDVLEFMVKLVEQNPDANLFLGLR